MALFDREPTVNDKDFSLRHNRRVRTRNRLHHSPPSIQQFSTTAGDASPVTSTGTPYGSYERTVDYNHGRFIESGKPRRPKGRRWIRLIDDIGGPFTSEKVTISRPHHITYDVSNILGFREVADAYVHTTPTVVRYANSLFNKSFSSGLPVLSDWSVLAHGTTGIARTIPTAPEMSLAQTIGEIKKDGLPSLPASRIAKDRNLASLGSEYLNYVFGISPLASDVSSLISLTRKYESIIEQFRRDQGRMIRRRITLVDEEDVLSQQSLRNNSAVAPQWNPRGDGLYDENPYSNRGIFNTRNRSERVSTARKVWFSGAYAISYPNDLTPLLTQLREFNRVYGVIPTPELAWELLPWSWLVDWFTNFGDVVRNVSYLSTPLTRLAFGYVMCEEQHRIAVTADYHANSPYLAGNRVGSGTTVLTHSYKRRMRASPFGFGITFGGLSNHQKAILAALGLSRLGN